MNSCSAVWKRNNREIKIAADVSFRCFSLRIKTHLLCLHWLIQIEVRRFENLRAVCTNESPKIECLFMVEMIIAQ